MFFYYFYWYSKDLCPSGLSALWKLAELPSPPPPHTISFHVTLNFFNDLQTGPHTIHLPYTLGPQSIFIWRFWWHHEACFLSNSSLSSHCLNTSPSPSPSLSTFSLSGTKQIASLFLVITVFWVLCVAWARPCGYAVSKKDISVFLPKSGFSSRNFSQYFVHLFAFAVWCDKATDTDTWLIKSVKRKRIEENRNLSFYSRESWVKPPTQSLEKLNKVLKILMANHLKPNPTCFSVFPLDGPNHNP